MIVEYLSSFGSFIASRNNIPSVIYLRNVVPCSVISSNRMEYPTCFPSCTTRSAELHGQSSPSISSATLLATLIAATLRGCVQATIFPRNIGRSE
jgi:hypothetical protein